MTARILIVDDHPLFRTGVRQALMETGEWTEVEEAGSLAEARRLLDRRSDLDLVLLDLALPDGSGLDLLEERAGRREGPRFVILSMSAEIALARRALRAGAQGYVSKEVGLGTLLLGLRLVLMGELFVEGELLRDLLTVESRSHAVDPASLRLLEALSVRERESLELLLEGLGTKEIAKRLGVSVRTAENYQSALYAKLGAASPVALVRFGLAVGLLR